MIYKRLKYNTNKYNFKNLIQEIYDTEKWHADHIVAFSRGGSTTVDNCLLIRKEDNLRKGNRTI